MIVELYKDFSFDAAHYLPMMPEGHKCRRLHGHTWRVRIVVRGEVNPDTGILMDYAEIKAAWDRIADILDHRLLNDIAGLANPTTENLAHWIFIKISRHILVLDRIEIQESCTSGCVFRGEME